MWALKELGGLLRKRSATIPLALPVLAALTPDGYDVTLVDEESSRIDFSRRHDIVGISSIVTNTARAYELAARFREAGSHVVLGGPYTSLNHEESLPHADTVIVGEAEELWPRFLRDFEAGAPLPLYQADRVPSIARQPIPRWDLIDTSRCLALNVQVSRGCPNGCDFCCVTRMFGGKQRFREIDNVIAEIEALPLRQISFVDDNFTSDKAYTRALVARLKPLEISWNCLCGNDVADDPALLAEMADAGCHTILVGFESLDPESLAIARAKRDAVGRYRQVVETINRAGIHVTGAFIVGFDQDTVEAFDRILDFYLSTDISYVMLNILTAFPGTRLHDAMLREGRALEIPSRFLTGVFPSIRYTNIGPEEIFRRNLRTYERIYSWDVVARKMDRIFASGNYTHPRHGIGFWPKVYGMASVLRRFLLSRDPAKRRLIRDVFGRIRRNEIDPNHVFEYLFFIEAANDYIARYASMEDELVGRIMEYAGTGAASPAEPER
jgi:radical SAM superfamily enzyme YgiQ (UPF0313 family)